MQVGRSIVLQATAAAYWRLDKIFGSLNAFPPTQLCIPFLFLLFCWLICSLNIALYSFIDSFWIYMLRPFSPEGCDDSWTRVLLWKESGYFLDDEAILDLAFLAVCGTPFNLVLVVMFYIVSMCSLSLFSIVNVLACEMISDMLNSWEILNH